MTTELEKLKDDLLSLPSESRASLAQALIASLDENVDGDAEQLWKEEVRRRDKDVRSGKATLRSADKVLHDALERLRCLK